MYIEGPYNELKMTLLNLFPMGDYSICSYVLPGPPRPIGGAVNSLRTLLQSLSYIALSRDLNLHISLWFASTGIWSSPSTSRSAEYFSTTYTNQPVLSGER